MARYAHTDDSPAPIMNIMAEVCSIFPIPTSGDMIPPERKQIAPSIADAVPAFFRSLSRASVVDAVNVNPIMKSMTN